MGLLSFSKLFLIIAWFRAQGFRVQPIAEANLRPFGAHPSRGRRENAASQTSHEEGLRYENAAFPILSFRAKARNLFRSRSGKGCEDSGEREAPCSQRIGRTVFHADSITKENGNGKRKRSLGCARDDETRERLFPFLFNLLRKPTSAPKGRIRIKCSAVLCKSIYESSIIKQMIWTGWGLVTSDWLAGDIRLILVSSFRAKREIFLADR